MRKDSGAVTPLLASPKLRAEYLNRNNSLLSVPLAGPIRPIRPLSPDTLSNLSLEDYDAIRLVRRSQSTHEAEPLSQSPAVPARGIRGWLGRFWVRNKGLGYMLIAQVFGTLMNVTTRILEVEGNKGKGLHPFQILFARMGITFVLATAYMWWKKTPDFPLGKPQVRWLLVARGLGGFCGVFGMYYSLLYLPLADATVMTFLAPSLACWACSFLINEPFTRGEQIGTLVSLIGIVFIAKPTMLFDAFGSGANMPPASGNSDFAPGANGTMPAGADAGNYDDVTPMQRLQAVGIAMIGVLGSATAYTTIRWIGKRAHPLISVNYFAGWCFLVSIIMQSVLPGVGFLLPADLKEWGYLIFLGTCGFVMVSLTSLPPSCEHALTVIDLAIPPRRWALLRKVLPRYEHRLHPDAVRPQLRQARLWPLARHDEHRRV